MNSHEYMPLDILSILYINDDKYRKERNGRLEICTEEMYKYVPNANLALFGMRLGMDY